MKNFITNLYNTAKKAIYNPEFYVAARAHTFKSRFIYLAKLIFASAVLILVLQYVRLIYVAPEVARSMTSIGSKVLSFYPQNLVVTFKNNELNINQKMPYSLTPPALESIVKSAGDGASKLIVIDHAATSENFGRYNALIVVNSQNFLVKSQNKIEVYNIAKTVGKDFVFTADTYKTYASQLKTILDNPGKVIFAFALVFGAIFLALGTVFNLLFAHFFIAVYSFFSFIAAKLVARSKAPYSYFFYQGIYQYTAIVVLQFFATLAGLQLGSLVYLLSFMVLTYLNLPEFKKTTAKS